MDGALCAWTLLDNGADPNLPDLRGRTPLHIAASLGFRDSAEASTVSDVVLHDGGRC